jgi:anti-anti-sigma factor
MHRKHRPAKSGDRGGVGVAARGNRDAASRPSRATLELVRPRPDRGFVTSGPNLVSDGRKQLVAGELVVRRERRPDALILWLVGELDRATVTLLDRELDGPAISPIRLVVDLTGLEFIDSTGLDALARIHRCARARGDRLSFRYGAHVARDSLELTRTIRLRSRWATRHASVNHGEPYFARAMACDDVDHPPSGGRPRAA